MRPGGKFGVSSALELHASCACSPHAQRLIQTRTRGLRREGAPGKGSDARVSNDALIVCEDRLREHVYALIEGEEYDSVSRSW